MPSHNLSWDPNTFLIKIENEKWVVLRKCMKSQIWLDMYNHLKIIFKVSFYSHLINKYEEKVNATKRASNLITAVYIVLIHIQ